MIEAIVGYPDAVYRAINELMVAYHSDDHLLIRDKIEQIDHATQRLAEIIMNNAVGKALEGGSFSERLVMWQAALHMVVLKPVTGFGLTGSCFGTVQLNAW